MKVFTNRLKYILRHRYLFKILATIVIIMTIILTSSYQFKSVLNENDTIFTGVVYKKKISDNKITFYIKGRERLVVNYYGELKENISLGDEISVSGTLSLPSNNTIPNLFNYKKYLYYNKIYYTIKADNIVKIANNTNVIYYLRDKISKRIDKISNSSEYIKIFILGDSSSLEENISESFRENGISHLFSISGMHISLFASIILYVLKRISYNNYYNYGIVIIFLTFYSLLVGSSPSVIRSLTMYILFSLNKLFNLKINKIDLMCMVLIILLIINPYYLYNVSFQFSYIISFSLILYSYKISHIKNKILKSIYTSFISFLVSFPICIYNYYQVNFLSIFLNIILIPLVSIIIFPLSLICFILPKLSFFLQITTNILQTVSLTISSLNIGIISFSKPSIILIIVYYLFIFLFLHNKKNFYIFLIIITHKLSIYLNPIMEITYLDVGQGDSIFLKYPYNQGNILIDTGGIINSDYSIVLNKTIPYLKSKGITKIDYLILTHGDYDHMGEAINLFNNFKVKKVILNCGEFNELEKNLIKVLEKKKIPYYSCIKELNIDKYKLQFLNTGVYDNENDNSSVIYLNYDNYKFLFMGDVSTTREKDIL
ncbi:MAG: DNA internalization-related competence protein ComEC/Rec2, partial [Bacilli bacterium]